MNFQPDHEEDPPNFAPHIEEAGEPRRAWNLEDVPIETSPRMSTFENMASPVPIHGAETSLPSPSELRASAFRRGRHSTGPESILSYRSRRRSRWMQLIVVVGIALCTVLVGAIILNRPSQDQAPTKGMKHVKAYLEDQGVSQASDLNNKQSSRYKAADWLANVDDAVVPDHSIHHHDSYRFLARYIMALMYFELGESSWKFHLDFLSPLDVCDWNGIVIDNPQNVMKAGLYCDAIGNLPIYLRMSKNRLRGTIPTELFLLTTLRTLELEGNELESTIPTEICQLENLHSLHLGRNQFSGEVPDCLDRMDALSHLSINNNLLENDLPSALENMYSLTQLYVDDNQFTGNPTPIFDKLGNMEILMANDNLFTGVLDTGFLESHDRLAWLDLSGNEFTSPLNVGFPVHLLELENLEVLDISRNKLEGIFPDQIPVNNRLKFLSVYGNFLIGNLPMQINNLKVLHHLDLSENIFSGPLLHSFGTMTSLRALFLGGNSDLEAGGIPTSFESLVNLEDLSLRQTNRVGPLPTLRSLKNLVLLDLGSNEFTGEIPDTYGNFVYLEFFMLNHNRNVTGAFPQVMEKLTKLRAIFLDGTSLTGNVEEVVCSLPKFLDMDGHEVAYADCESDLSCECCECCTDGCSVPFQLNLRNSWVKDFQKLNFQFNNSTAFLNRDYIPPVQNSHN